jgi:hypothetical protein
VAEPIAEPVIAPVVIAEPVIVPPAKSDADIAEEKRLLAVQAEADAKANAEAEKNGKLVAIDSAIMEKINASPSKDIISVRDLEAIAGRSLSTEDIVGTIKLRKVFKQSFYRLR